MSQELNQSILNAIGETFNKYGVEHTEIAVYVALKEGDFTGFTNKGAGARAILKRVLQENMDTTENPNINIFLEGILSCYLENISDRSQALSVEEEFVHDAQNMFYRTKEYPQESMRQIISSIYDSYEEKNNAMRSSLKMTNIKLHSSNMQYIKDNMISGLTLAKEGEIHVRDMHACTKRGKKRENQEDAILLRTHPQNKKFKLLAVSDGMGGGAYGEIASTYIVTEISKWFDELPAAYYKNPELLSRKLVEQLSKISRNIANEYYGNVGATFVGALVCEDETVIVNVGDSRAYTYDKKKNQLTQQSKDHSYVEELYQAGFIKERDDMRFHVKANSITQYVGMPENTVDIKFVPNITRVPNKNYDVVLLFSDGVTDYLSDQEILVVTKDTKKSELARRIIDVAMDSKSMSKATLPREFYVSKREGGGDNLSVALRINKSKRIGRGEEI